MPKQPSEAGPALYANYGANGSLAQMHQIQLSGSFASYDEPLPHSGLGEHESIQSLSIRWQDGEETTISSEFSANTRYRISRLSMP